MGSSKGIGPWENGSELDGFWDLNNGLIKIIITKWNKIKRWVVVYDRINTRNKDEKNKK